MLGSLMTGFATLGAPVLAGAMGVALFPQLIGSLPSWIALSLFWWGGALWTGVSLARTRPRRGMAACMTLAAIVEIVVMAAALESGRGTSSNMLVLYTIAAFVPVLMIGGGLVARHPLISRAHTLEGLQ